MTHALESPPRRHGSRGRLALGLLAAAWFVALLLGFALVVDFETRPGAVPGQITAWPAESRLTLADSGATIVMFLHPECPCSRASLDELDRLLHSSQVPVKVYLVVVDPGDSDWRRTSNAARAAKIAGALVRLDPHGETAQQFGSQTSGDVFVFDRAGQLRFEGGITAARGHSGPNAASAAAAEAIEGRGAATCHMPVFGCSLF